MASRRTSKASSASQAPLPFDAPDSGVVVFEDPKRRRLKLLEKEHQRLLRSIRTKRSSLDASERAASDAANDLRNRIEPFHDEFLALAAKIHAVFRALLEPTSRLSDRARRQVSQVYRQVATGILRGMPDGADEDDFDDPWSEVDAEHRGGAGGRGKASEAGRGGGGRFAEGPFAEGKGDAGYSAAKPAEDGNETLRALFRRLAIALHPDKTQDAAEKATRTETMKEVTRAYETGDVARLVELERAWLASTPLREDDTQVERRILELDAANKELRKQLRALTRVAKSTKQVLSEIPTGRGLEEMMKEAEGDLRELERLLDFVTQFSDGKLSMAQFLQGPPLGRRDDDDISFDDLPEILAAMADEFFAEEVRPRRKTPRKKKRPTGKKHKK